MKTVLVFADSLTYPGKEGVSQHVIGLLDALSRVDTIRPVLLMCDRGTISQEQLSDLAWSTVLVPHSIYYDYSKIKDVIDSIKPDILQSYSVYQARLISSRYSLEHQVPLVMEHHGVDTEFIDGYGLEGEVRNYQLDIIELASLNRTLSSRDETILMDYAPSRTHTFVNMPSSIISSYNIKRSTEASNHVLFIGNGAYPPNKKALDFIHRDLATKLPHITFHLVGRLTDTYDSLRTNIIGHGMVDDISQILSKVSYGIAPLEKGSGLKIKVTTYLSAGLPVIGTAVAFQGYEENQALIEATIDDFADRLSYVIKNGNRAELSDCAKAEYLEHYSSDSNISKLVRIYHGLEFDAEANEANSHSIHYDPANLPWLREFREKKYPVTSDAVYINFSRSS